MCPPLACTPSTGPHASPPIKIHPSCFAIHPSFDLRLALFLWKSPSFATLIRGGVLCSPLVVYVWCCIPSLRLVFTPPTANAYTTWSCYARLPARFGHNILSCRVQFEGMLDRTMPLRLVLNYSNMRNKRGVILSLCIEYIMIFCIL